MVKSKRYYTKKIRNKSRRKSRIHIGGGKKEQANFLRALWNNDEMRKLGATKPVATPYSSFRSSINGETNTGVFIRLWKALNDADKVMINNRYKLFYGFTINVYITPKEYDPFNQFIIYAVEYLDLLAKAANRSVDEILQMIAARGHKSEDDLDIINIAFNDKEIMNQELSEKGKELESKYFFLVDKKTAVNIV